jgi:hypothetical protein
MVTCLALQRLYPTVLKVAPNEITRVVWRGCRAEGAMKAARLVKHPIILVPKGSFLAAQTSVAMPSKLRPQTPRIERVHSHPPWQERASHPSLKSVTTGC